MQHQFYHSGDPSTLTRAAELATRMREARAPVANDAETTGLDPHTDKVTLLSLSSEAEGTHVFDTRDAKVLGVFKDLLEDHAVPKIGFNNPFDYKMYKGTAGIEMENIWDLFFAEHCMTAGQQMSGRSLEDVTLKYLGKQRDKSLQKSFIGHKGEFSKEQIAYAAEDTSDLIPLSKTMAARIKSEGLTNVWKIENGALQAFADIEFYGDKIDRDQWQQVIEWNQKKEKEAEGRLNALFAPYFDRDLWGELHINYNSQPTVLYGLQMMGIKIDGETIKSTGKEVMKKIIDLPVIMALEAHRQAVKATGTYGQPYLDAIHPITGRIHPKINQYGTETGRPTNNKPSLLNIPRDKRYRNAFITDYDRLISTVDYSGCELRILAEYSNDPLMVHGFNSGVDFHCFVAAMLFGKEKVDKKDPLRQPTKAINFGLAYGSGPRRLFAQLNAEGYKITLEECRTLFDKYKEKFKTCLEYLQVRRTEARNRLTLTNPSSGRKRSWIKPDPAKIYHSEEADRRKKLKRNLTSMEILKLKSDVKELVKGRYAGIEREGGNFDPQSVNADMTKVSMCEIRHACKKRGYDARMYNSVYDEIVLDIKKTDAEAVHELQKKIMVEVGSRYVKRVPIEVEGHLLPYWTK